MKHMKKLLSLVLTLVTVFALSATAMAATVTIPEALEGHTFVAYQIFTGSQASSEGELGNVAWGDGINDVAFLAALKADKTIGSTFTSCTTADDVAKALAGISEDNAEIVANLADANKKGTGTALKVGDENTLADGYYLIVDATNLDNSQDANNPALLNLTRDIDIGVKYNVPSVEKKVKDKNDSDGTISDWQDSADHDIGDEIEFQLTGTLPSNYADYETYKYIFHDTMTKLTYKVGSVKVMVGETDVTSSFTPTFDAATKKLTVSCDDLKAIKGVTIDKDSKIVVTYIATLDSDANIGATGNPNVVKLEFSNNPNYGGDGDTGFTPEDKVTVFTFKVIVNKTDGTNALTGAAFTLYKKNTDNVYVAVPQQVTITENGTKFEWKGLDDGDYKLSETTTPPGYNTAADIEFTITAEHEIESDDPKLTNLGNVEDFTIDTNAGSLTTAVVNNKGTLLPETGGIGTTIFYVLGGVMMAGAVVLMVTKRRMNAER